MRRILLPCLVALTVVALAGGGAFAGSGSRADPPRTEAAPPGPPPPLHCDADPAPCERLAELLAAGAAQKEPGLAWPLVQLAEAQEQAGGARITASQSGALPKSLQDFVAARRLHLDDAGRVQVFVHSRGPAGALAGELEGQGAAVERVAEDQGIVQAWVPIGRLPAIAKKPGAAHVSLPDYGRPQTGSVTSQGDTLLNVASARSTFGYDGSGVRVGVVSDGVEGLAASQASGDMPAVNTATCDVAAGTPTSTGAGAEGLAMLEIVHDLAPGAELWFGYANLRGAGTILDFMAAVNCLAQNVDVVVDDLAWYNVGPYNGTSFVSVNASRTVEQKSNRARAYVNAVGNEALSHYQGQFVNSATLFPTLPGLHLFQRTSTTGDAFNVGPDIADQFFLFNGGLACMLLQWNDPFSASSNDYNMALIDSDRFFNGDPNFVVALSQDPQTGSQEPVEELCFVNTGPDGFFGIFIAKTPAAQARNLDMFLLCLGCPSLPDGLPGQPVHNYNTACSSVPNNSDARGAVIALGAIDATLPGANAIEPYSSCGPTEDGRVKPDAAGVDGVDVTGNGGFGSPFFGTSAAAPHGAAIAALLLQCQRNLSPAGLRATLMSTATDLGQAGVDNRFGAGRLHAFNALSATTCLVAKNAGGDTDGDTLTNGVDPNDDNDACLDTRELQPYALQGGRRDPHNRWDFMEVPVGAGLTRDGVITAGDLAGVIARFGSSDTGPGAFDRNSDPLSTPNPAVQPSSARQNYHPAYDRGGSINRQNPWNLLPANGSISAGDIAAIVSQFGHSCA